jgi:hypothetical protein
VAPIDARAFLHTAPLPGMPTALLYVSPPIGDPAADVLPAFLAEQGLPLTVVEDEQTFLVQPAGPGWRCGISPTGRLAVTGRGHTLVDVERLSAVPGWAQTALAERLVLVAAGPPVPFTAGAASLRDVLTWIGTRPTCSATMPAVEIHPGAVPAPSR